jgi:putative tricarboxylic transport membrane protein
MRKNNSWLVNLFWIGIGAYVFLQAYSLGIGKLHQPGPGFIFFGAGLLLAGLSAIEMILRFSTGRVTLESKPDGWTGIRWSKIFFVLAAMAGYIFFLNGLGFLLSTFLLMVFLFKGIEPTKWWIAVTAGVITTLLSYWVFEVWLTIPFPRGLFNY